MPARGAANLREPINGRQVDATRPLDRIPTMTLMRGRCIQSEPGNDE